MTTTKPREIFINEECFECHGEGSVLIGGIEQHTQGHIACSACLGTGYLEISAIEHSAYQAALEEIDALKAKVAKYEEALRFYADLPEDEDIYEQLDWSLVNNQMAIQDKGKRARQALEEK